MPIETATRVSARTSAPTLIAVIATAVTLPFGQSVTGVQLDSIGASLHGGVALLQWVANGYNLAFSALLLIAGSLADLVGRRRVFVASTCLFLVGSLLSAAAPSLALLDVCRFITGAGAAGQLASAPALLAAAFETPGPARARAFGLLGTGFGVGLALGPVVGGLLVTGPGWRWAFLIVVPFAMAALAAAWFIQEPPRTTPHSFDRPGAISFAACLALLMLALGRIAEHGWTDAAALGLAAAAIVAGGIWARVEGRRSAPLFDLRVLRDPSFLGASAAWWAAAFGFVSLLIYVPFFLQATHGHSAFEAGLALLPMTIPLLLVPSVAPTIAARVGVVGVVLAGTLIIAGGDVCLAQVRPAQLQPWLGIGLALVGIGAGSINGLLDNIAMSAIPAERAGMAAGGFQTMRVAGDAVAIAVAGSILAPLTSARVRQSLAGGGIAPDQAAAIANHAAHGSLDRQGLPGGIADMVLAAVQSAETSAFSALLLTIAVVTSVCGAIGWWLLRSGARRTREEHLL